MDIFTTQLSKVVPVPIKNNNLKVKALVKQAETSKLKEDPDHLENHDYYFDTTEQKNESSSQEKKAPLSDNNDASKDDEHQLDIFV